MQLLISQGSESNVRWSATAGFWRIFLLLLVNVDMMEVCPACRGPDSVQLKVEYGSKVAFPAHNRRGGGGGGGGEEDDMDVCRFYDITDGFFGSSCPWESSLRGDEVGRETPLTGCTA